MATVTVDAVKYERLLKAASMREPYCSAHWPGACESLQPGDLDPVAPDPEPSVGESLIRSAEAENEYWLAESEKLSQQRIRRADPEPSVESMLDALNERWVYVELTMYNDGASRVVADFGGVESDNWRDALRAAYQAVIGDSDGK